MTPTQMFMITARKEDILETLPYYEHFMPWITGLLICCPASTREEIQSAYTGHLQISYITDEELFAERPKPKDHQVRNFLIRSLVIKSDLVDPVFIMADDDNRPLGPVSPEFFVDTEPSGTQQPSAAIQPHNPADAVPSETQQPSAAIQPHNPADAARSMTSHSPAATMFPDHADQAHTTYRLYYYYTSADLWHGAPGAYTSYDRGLLYTSRFLTERGLPDRIFSVHAPQIIVRDVFREALEKYPEAMEAAVDEWSFYGDYAAHTYPERFSINPYETLCWPGMPTDWLLDVHPQRYTFENFYRSAYAEDGIFTDFDTQWSKKTEYTNTIKMRLRDRLQHEYEHKRTMLDIPTDWSLDAQTGRLSMTPSSVTGACIYTTPSDFAAKVNIRIMNADPTQTITFRYIFYGLEGHKPRRYIGPEVTLNHSDDPVMQVCIYSPIQKYSGNLRLEFRINGRKTVKNIKMSIT